MYSEIKSGFVPCGKMANMVANEVIVKRWISITHPKVENDSTFIGNYIQVINGALTKLGKSTIEVCKNVTEYWATVGEEGNPETYFDYIEKSSITYAITSCSRLQVLREDEAVSYLKGVYNAVLMFGVLD